MNFILVISIVLILVILLSCAVYMYIRTDKNTTKEIPSDYVIQHFKKQLDEKIEDYIIDSLFNIDYYNDFLVTTTDFII